VLAQPVRFLRKDLGDFPRSVKEPAPPVQDGKVGRESPARLIFPCCMADLHALRVCAVERHCGRPAIRTPPARDRRLNLRGGRPPSSNAPLQREIAAGPRLTRPHNPRNAASVVSRARPSRVPTELKQADNLLQSKLQLLRTRYGAKEKTSLHNRVIVPGIYNSREVTQLDTETTSPLIGATLGTGLGPRAGAAALKRWHRVPRCIAMLAPDPLSARRRYCSPSARRPPPVVTLVLPSCSLGATRTRPT